MHSVLKAVLKSVPSSIRSSCLIRPSNVANSAAARSLWNLSNRSSSFNKNSFNTSSPTLMCSCGCGSMKAHTKAEQELVEFLTEEIAAEKKLQKASNIPTEVCGFKVKLEGSEVSLTKSSGDETIEINFNVNHSVDTDTEPEINQSMDKPEMELKSRPTFEVDLKRGGQTLGFTCSYISEQRDQDDENYTDDIFGIDEVTFYSGEWKDSNYAVSGEVLDGYLYDLLMNLLEEKGVNNELMEKVSNFATSYEHHSYIQMLQSVQKFASGK